MKRTYSKTQPILEGSPSRPHEIERMKERIKLLESQKVYLEDKLDAYEKIIDKFPLSIKRLLAGQYVDCFDDRTKSLAINLLGGGSIPHYEYIRKQVIPLPSVSTVLRWVGPVVARTGLITSVMEALEEASLDPLDKSGCLVLDETAISPGFRLNDSGSVICGGISSEFQTSVNQDFPAKKALLYIYKSIHSGKKIPVASYFTHSDTNADQLFKVTKHVIKELEKRSLKIHIVITDMFSGNVKMYKKFGLNQVEGCASHPCDASRKLLFAPDPEHLIKSIRNHFIDGNIFVIEGREASIEPVIAMLILEESNQIPKVSRITASDIFMKNSFVKMKVQPALDLFSNSTVKGLEKLKEEVHLLNWVDERMQIVINHLPGTIELIQNLAEFIDSCFSGCILSNDSLEPIIKAASSIHSMRYKGSVKWSLKPFQTGIKLFSTTLSNLLKYNESNSPVIIKYINSACVENAFSFIKKDFPCPDSQQFLSGLKWLTLCEMNLTKNRNSSLEETNNLIGCIALTNAAKKRRKLENNIVNTLIIIPLSYPYLTLAERNYCSPIIMQVLSQLEEIRRENNCQCNEENNFVKILEVAFKNLHIYLDNFKGENSLSTKIFAKRIHEAVLDASLFEPCDHCNLQLNLEESIRKFIKLELIFLLGKHQFSNPTDHSSRSMFVKTFINYNKRPTTTLTHQLEELGRKRARTPFGREENSISKRNKSTYTGANVE